MIETINLCAQQSFNQWLSDHPAVLGLFLLTIGGILAASGVWELKKGVSKDKYGNEIKGKFGKIVSILRLVVGGGIACVGIYKLISGIL